MPPVNSGQQFVVTLARVIGAHLEGGAPAAGVAAGTTFRGELSSAVPRWVWPRRIPASAGYEGASGQPAHLAGPVRITAGFAVFQYWPNFCPSAGRLSSNFRGDKRSGRATVVDQGAVHLRDVLNPSRLALLTPSFPVFRFTHQWPFAPAGGGRNR